MEATITLNGENGHDAPPPAGGPAVELATHFFRQRYLFAFAPQAEVQEYLRTQALEEERARQGEIMEAWQELQPKVLRISNVEAGLADAIVVRPIPPEHQEKLDAFAADPVFERAFARLPWRFALVEVDKLIAAQRTVNLDYVERLMEMYPSSPGLDDLMDICLSPTRAMEPIQHLEIAPNVHVFSSPNADIRHLGSFVKELSTTDLEASMGGLPVAAVISFVGYGTPCVNVLQIGNRYVLNNGFHRVYALRSRGVLEIPVVVQEIHNPALEFPPVVADLPRDYLLGMARPALIGDFFVDGFATTLKARDRVKTVMVAVNVNQHPVPA